MSFRSLRNNVNDDEILCNVFYINKGYTIGVKVYKDATIEDLQRIIGEKNNIPYKEQMIFLSDGSRPNPDALLSEHDYATSEKPLFLYRRTSQEKVSPVVEEIEGIHRFQTEFLNVVEPAIESQNLNDIKQAAAKTLHFANLIVRVCTKVVHDHKFLAEGWSAMVAYLDDQISRLYRRYGRLESIMKKMETAKANSNSVLEDFNSVFDKLRKISLPPELAGAMTDSDDGEYTLYDWIRSKDPVFHLNDLVGHVQNSLNILDDAPIKRIKPNMDDARKQINDRKVRFINGLDERLRTLNERQEQTASTGSTIENAAGEIYHNMEIHLQNPQTLRQLKDGVLKMVKDVEIYSRSKLEVLTALQGRTKNNFVPIYDSLDKADGNMVVFEEKAKTLIDQLNLLNQIRETPILYVTAVAEVIRRQTLQKEFGEWLEMIKEKCSTFLEEENQLRNDIHRKLEKHFLRQLFRGVSQLMPSFQPHVSSFDTNLPKIDNSYLHMLREKFQDMSALLNVTAPNVFRRLTIVDKNSPNLNEISHATLRREESFFVPGRTINIDTLNRNHPSTNYLQNIDAECSPGSYSSMNRFGTYSSQTSLAFSESGVGTPMSLKPITFDCRPKDEFTISPQKAYPYSSDPIAVPTRGMTSSNQISTTSSQFSTPEDTMTSERFRQPHTDDEQVRKVDVATNELQNLKEFIPELLSQINEIRNAVQEECETVKVFDKENIDEVWRRIREEMDKQLEEQKKIVEEVKEENGKLAEIVEHEKYLRREKEKEVHEQNITIERQNTEILEVIKAKDDLHADILRLETEKRKLEDRIHSEASVDYLGIELKTLEDILRRPLAHDEVDRIKSEIEKRRVSSPTPSEQNEREGRNTNSHAEYEKAYRTKMNFIIQGIENKKIAEIAKVRDEIQTEVKKERENYEKSMQEKIKDLEEQVLFYKKLEEQQLKGPFVDAVTIADNVITNSHHSEPFLPKSMLESCMVVNANPTTSLSKTGEFPATQEEDEDAEIAEDDITSINTIGTQTRICLKEMNMMISLHDIHEGCSVLVMWDNSHNSYMVFSTSRSLHFVRESSMRRFGVDAQSPARRNWMFAVVTNIEYCQIRKENNRYNMPLGTRFYRVEVKPLAIEQSSSAPTRRT
uniref:Autophagy-related protein 11 C-terminal domain-containing protein n=1 Tax=Panagrolaimus sp. PS1159 TaxID=55785 RepID=A0AC35FZ13_9BILA